MDVNENNKEVWKEVSTQIWVDGFRKGEDKGYQEGLDHYSRTWKAMFNAKVITIGLAIGLVVGMFLGMGMVYGALTPEVRACIEAQQ